MLKIKEAKRMSNNIIIKIYKVMSQGACTLIGGLAGFILLGFYGAILGIGVGYFFGKLLEKRILDDAV